MGEAKQNELEARGYGSSPTAESEILLAQYQAYCSERGEIAEDYPWPSEQQMDWEAEHCK